MVCGSAGYGLISSFHCCFLTSPGGRLLPAVQFLSGSQLSPHTKKNKSPPPTTGLANKCISTAVRVIAHAMPGTVLNSWILFYEVKPDYHPILQVIYQSFQIK